MEGLSRIFKVRRRGLLARLGSVLGACAIEQVVYGHGRGAFDFLGQVQVVVGLGLMGDAASVLVGAAIHILDNEFIFGLVRFLFYRDNFLSQTCVPLFIYCLFEYVFLYCCK